MSFFLEGWGASFTAYLVIQAASAIALEGKARLIALIPVVPMTVVVVVTWLAYSQDSNMWPILMIMASPIAFGFVAVVWAASLLQGRKRGSVA